MGKYAFVIDLKRCFGCYACQMNCKAEYFTPPGVFWARVLKGEAGKYPSVIKQPLPILCMQCEDPECKKVCPTKATDQRPDGVVTIDKSLCVGCRYCIVVCPYGSRYFVEGWRSYFPGENPLSIFEEYARNKWVEKYGEGTVTKCNFCVERVEVGLEPKCVEGCPAKARYFGNLDDPESEVSELIKTEKGFQLATEFGTKPRVYYLPPR